MKPRVLVLAESLPYPTLKGGDHRTWRNVNALASFADVGVFGLCSNDVRRHEVPDIPLAFWLASTDPALAYPPPVGHRLPARRWLFEAAGHPSDLYLSEGAARELSDLVARFRPAAIVVEGVWLRGYLEVVRGAACRCILDCPNVEAALFRELASATTADDLESRVIRDVLPPRTERLERAAIQAADQIWVCSAADERRLRALYTPSAPIRVIPNAINIEDYAGVAANRRSDAEVPLTLLFTGFFPYRPNGIAAMFLVDEVFPRLAAAYPECRLLLVGAGPSEALKAAAARDQRIVVTGAVRDMNPWLARATALAVPLFQGGGTRLKMLEAFAAGLPVISTAKGAEGLDARHGTHVLLAERAEEFVDAALAIARDRMLAARLAERARALVADRYSWQTTAPAIRDSFDAVVAAA